MANSINYNDELKAAIKAATMFTYGKNDRPALTCVLINATADSVSVYATDSFIAFRYTCKNDEGGQFSALLSAADAKALASVKLQANALYNLAVDDGTLKTPLLTCSYCKRSRIPALIISTALLTRPTTRRRASHVSMRRISNAHVRPCV